MKKAVFLIVAFPIIALETLKLSNGLTIVIERRDIPAIAMTLIYRAGSFYDPYGAEGTSYLLNQLSFQGTRRTGPWEEVLFLKRIGGEADSEVNFDYVLYHSVFPKEEFPLVLWFEAERMKNLELTPSKIITSRAILASQVQRNYQMDLRFNIYSSLIKACFKGTPYSHPPTGFAETIARIPPRRLVEFYRQYYTPANLTIVLVGKIEPKYRELIKKMFSQVRSSSPFSPSSLSFPVGENRIRIRTNLAKREAFLLAYRISPADLKTRIAFDMLRAFMERKMEEEMLKSGDIVDYSVEVQHLVYASLFYIFVSNDNLKKWFSFVNRQLQSVRTVGIKASQLRQLKELLSARLKLEKQNFKRWSKQLAKMFVIMEGDEESYLRALVEISPLEFRELIRRNTYTINRTEILIEPWK